MWSCERKKSIAIVVIAQENETQMENVEVHTKQYVAQKNLWKCKQICVWMCLYVLWCDRSRLFNMYLIRFECAVVLASSCEKFMYIKYKCIHKQCRQALNAQSTRFFFLVINIPNAYVLF